MRVPSGRTAVVCRMALSGARALLRSCVPAARAKARAFPRSTKAGLSRGCTLRVNGKVQRFSCNWNCYYCPNEEGQPRSYLHDEPGVIRECCSLSLSIAGM